MADDPSPALLIIDMFSRFDFPGAQALVPAAERAARQIRRLRDHFDDHGWPVIYANDNFSDWKRDFRQQVEQCRRDGGGSRADSRAALPLARSLLRAQAQALGVPRHPAAGSAGQAGRAASLAHRDDGRFLCSGNRVGCQRQGIRRSVGTGGRGGDAGAETARNGAARRFRRRPRRTACLSCAGMTAGWRCIRFRPGLRYPLHRHDRRNVRSRRSGRFPRHRVR